MRISLLAKKINQSPTELIRFFNKNELGNYTSHNNKVAEDHIVLAIKKFNPGLLELNENENDQNNPTIIPDDQIISVKQKAKIQDKKLNEKVSNISEHEPSAQIKKGIPGTELEIEVIRAPKIKLEGVKVIGKIELPEPKPKEKTKPTSDKAIDDAIQKVLKGKTTKPKAPVVQNTTRDHRTGKKITPGQELSYEEKLKREEKRRAKRKEIAARQKKEKKRQYYVKNIKPAIVAPKVNPKKKKQIDEPESLHARKRPVYKNPIRKLWGWLNGEYDNL